MTETQEKYYLDKLKFGVEKKLQWGGSDDWRHSDYKNLSEVIYEESKILLSTSTLKRVWGKIKYEGMPNATTLDALSMYIGYKNWLDFKNKTEKGYEQKEEVPISTPPIQQHKPTFLTRKKVLAGILVPALVVVAVLLFLKSFQTVSEEVTIKIPDNFVFELAEEPTLGIPQTVIINMDLTGFEVDSIYILELGRNKREYLPRNQKRHPYFCPLPGNHSIKLMYKNIELKKIDFYVYSNNWQAVISNKDAGSDKYWIVNLPTYLPSRPVEDGFLSVSAEVLKSHNVKVADNTWTTFYNFKPFDINVDNYTVETKMINSIKEGATTCQIGIFSVTTEKGLQEVWLVAPGCSKFTHILFGKIGKDGGMLDNKMVDLSEFEVDMNKWQDLKWTVNDKNVSVQLNNKEVYSVSYPESLGNITGLKYQFKGSGGRVDYLRLKDLEGNILYTEEFNELIS
ncbi:MAG: hypothetical protein AAGI07_12110, partial [Bacteroidota bacterium]